MDVPTRTAKWTARIQAWHASGESAEAFAKRHGCAVSTLYGWSRRVPRTAAPVFVELVPRVSVDRSPCELVIEVGTARVRVGSGFDGKLLSDVVRALGGGAQ